MKFFLEHGADINAVNMVGRTALMRATVNKKFEMIELLLKKGASINSLDNDKTSALLYIYTIPTVDISSKYKSKLVNILLKYGADVNIPNKYGYTPFMLAV